MEDRLCQYRLEVRPLPATSQGRLKLDSNGAGTPAAEAIGLVRLQG